MKKRISFLLTILTAVAVIVFAGCAKTSGTVNTITDIAGYSDMRTGGDKIEVHFENGTRDGFEFTIVDKTEIDEIVNIVLTTQLVTLYDQPVAPGDNTGFTLFQGDKSYVIQLCGVSVNKYRYAFSTDELRDKINSIAEREGAYDVEDGVD